MNYWKRVFTLLLCLTIWLGLGIIDPVFIFFMWVPAIVAFYYLNDTEID